MPTLECTCKVTPHSTKFDSACYFHGEDGTMVAHVRYPQPKTLSDAVDDAISRENARVTEDVLTEDRARGDRMRREMENVSDGGPVISFGIDLTRVSLNDLNLLFHAVIKETQARQTLSSAEALQRAYVSKDDDNGRGCLGR